MTIRQPARRHWTAAGFISLSLLFIGALAFAGSGAETTVAETAAGSYIVQGADFQAVSARVRDLGGEITHDLHLIDAVAAG